MMKNNDFSKIPLLEEDIKRHFNNKYLQNLSFFIYDTTDSTNTRAKIFAEEHPEISCAVFIADHQSAGRGRLGRSFDSEAGHGLYISFLTRSTETEISGELPTVRAAVDTAIAIEKISNVNVKIKWVNDIVGKEKKLAGILTEGKANPESGKNEYTVTGIGINLYNRKFPKEISDIAISLEELCEKAVSKADLAAALTEEFFKKKCTEDILSEYRSRSFILGSEITVRRLSGELFSAIAEEILDDGALLVKLSDGSFERLISAEVSIKPKNQA